MKYSYYPGCSMDKSAAAYTRSMLAIAEPLGVQLVEIDNWNCCAATESISLHRNVSYALATRNLALAAQHPETRDLVCPCSACYLNLGKVDRYLVETPRLAQQTNAALAEAGLSYTPGSIKVRHLVDVLANDVGFAAMAARVTRPLKGLKVASYYGCLLGRPGFQGQIDDPENPTLLDDMMRALGAQVVPFPLKAHCCGGHMTQLKEATGYAMISRLIKNATDHGADIIVTPCPMCQMNLDAFQGPVNRYFNTNYHMPVVYFTQLIGLAFGMDAQALGFGTELVDAGPGALTKIGVESLPVEAVPQKTVRRRDDKSLPMPPPLPQHTPTRRAAP